jgi:hypothetical protein
MDARRSRRNGTFGSLIPDTADSAKYMLVAGAGGGGGLTIIANAPNPAGVAPLREGFADESVGAGALFLGALPPTVVAAAAFLLWPAVPGRRSAWATARR